MYMFLVSFPPPLADSSPHSVAPSVPVIGASDGLVFCQQASKKQHAGGGQERNFKAVVA
jgi:hypothetical protein